MSLLQTNNKKFNIPFVFIAGVLFLVVLAYFAAYIETLSADVKSIEKTTISVRINKNQEVYIDDKKVSVEEIISMLKSKSEGSENTVIQLQSEDVSSQRTLEIMEIARNNDFTVVLEVSSK